MKNEALFHFSIILINKVIKNQQVFQKMDMKAQIINVSLSAITDYSTNIIKNTVTAEVHSIYNKTINLLINNKIFSLRPKDNYLSPVSFVTNFTLQQFQQLSLVEKHIYQLNFDTQNCAIFPSKLTACDNTQQNQPAFYAQIAQHIVQNAETAGLRLLFQDNIDDLILSAFKNYLVQIEAFYSMEDWENATITLAKLIGLGIGLTPSGDDFICGFLSAFQRFNQTGTAFYQNLSQKIQQNADNTNAISRRFIECALEQHFSTAILTFWDTRENNTSTLNHLTSLFESIGHSSGMDTLFGIYYACKLLSNQKTFAKFS